MDGFPFPCVKNKIASVPIGVLKKFNLLYTEEQLSSLKHVLTFEDALHK